MSNVFNCVGRLGSDAKVHQKDGGKPFARFSLANDVGYGERKVTQWITCWIFGKRASSGLIDHLKKGQAVFVSGELKGEVKDGKLELHLQTSVVDLVGNAPRERGQQGGGKRTEEFDNDVQW